MKINHTLDLQNETCPMTFVKAKLLLEKMVHGEHASILLNSLESFEQLPHSLGTCGGVVVETTGPLENKPVYRIVIQKE